jgi:poly(A) polymerase
MIRDLIRRVIKKARSGASPQHGPLIVKRDRHGIDRGEISSCALRTTEKLQEAGYRAFVVGGAVRDLLLKHEPKDFDVATDATPEQVRQTIRRSRIIGRRFRIVHALCGDDTVEVSTFRSMQPSGDEEDPHVDEHGRRLSDNVFGTQEEDASRRDFTINALFYDPATEEIWDYHHGVADVREKVIRVIGEPAARYREDPVRMLRAVRFAAKLEFKIDEASRKPIREMAPLLANVPRARVFEEMLKLLLSGHAWAGLNGLREEGLHHGVLPLLDVILEQPLGERFVKLALDNTDVRVREDKPVSPGFLFASLLWHEVLLAWQNQLKLGAKAIPGLHDAMDQVLETQKEKLHIPRRFDAVMKEIWDLQPRFEQRAGVRPFRLLEQARFRAAYDFMRLRCDSGELDPEIGHWWEAFQSAGEDQRKAMLLNEAPQRKRRRRRRGKSENRDQDIVQPGEVT